MEPKDKETHALNGDGHSNGTKMAASHEPPPPAAAPAGESDEERDTWSGKLDFIMSALSFAVGMGNLWRFPYLCYRNGGGAFLIPYLILMLLAGIPMMFLEMAFGQYGRQGVVSVWKVCPIFKGAGWAMFFVSLFTCGYYNMLNAWCIFYIAASFSSDVPWRDCDNSWNTEDCGSLYASEGRRNCTSQYSSVWYNDTCYSNATHTQDTVNNMSAALAALKQTMKSPSDQYFHHFMLSISSGIEEMGGVRWQLALCYMLVWLVVFVCLIKGIKTSGKVTYVTAIFPYIVLLILFIRGVTLEGAREGILFYLTPDWSRLGSAKVWGDAAVQVFFSLSLCWGGLVTLASYNKFNNNCLRDSIVVAVGDCLTSIFAGVVIFAFIGYMAHQMDTPVGDVATQGAGLAFIVYPQAVTTLPVSQLWAVLFMLMLINVGMGSQFTLVTTVQTTLVDEFPSLFKGRSTLLLAAVCLMSCSIGLIFCTRAGMYLLQLIDTYSATYALLALGIVLCVSLSWVYGTKHFFRDIEQMIGKKPGWYWLLCWKFITPSILLFVLIFTFVDFKRTSYGSYTFPVWSDVIGWMITITEIGSIPAVAVYKLATAGSGLTFMQRLRKVTRPLPTWHYTPGSTKEYELEAKEKLNV